MNNSPQWALVMAVVGERAVHSRRHRGKRAAPGHAGIHGVRGKHPPRAGLGMDQPQRRRRQEHVYFCQKSLVAAFLVRVACSSAGVPVYIYTHALI